MAYVDGFVLVVQKKHLRLYRSMARLGCKVWSERGALDYKECLGDDLKVKGLLPFPRLVKLKKNELVFFSFIVYKSRAHRNSVNAKVMKDPRLFSMMDPKKMPFDMKRMAYGGFKVIVDKH